jgi:ribonuclease BN (tRNA processing enzyme)
VELIVLGCDGGWPSAGGATSGYLLSDEGFNLWMDCGAGTMATLLEHMDVLDVGALAISHEHPDHFLDLFMHYVGRYFHPERPAGRLPVFLPPGLVSKAVPIQPDLSEIFDFQEVTPGDGFEAGPFRVTTGRMAHPVLTLGMRVEGPSATLAYSADTGPTPDLVELARDADLLLAEASWYALPERTPPLHLSGHEAGEHAAKASVDRLVVTHVWPTYDRAVILSQAKEAFAGPVTLAEKGLRIQL